MNNYRFIYEEGSDIFCGEIYKNRLITYYNSKNNIIGNIYRARIINYIKSMDSYTLDIGESKLAILKNKEVVSSIKVGDDVIVEILKVPNSDKLIEVTEKVTISDGYIVMLPTYTGSNKNVLKTKKIPYILRTRAKGLNNTVIDSKYKKLENRIELLMKEKNYLPTPKLLLKGNDLQEFILNYNGEIISNIKNLDSKVLYDSKFNPKYDKIISREITNKNIKKCDFDNGNIIIEELEAFTVIDVNSGNNHFNKDKETMSISVNLNSIEEIAIQIKYKNIKKMVIIDFIRVNNENKNLIKTELLNKFKEYNIKSKIFGFTSMGLFELIIY